MTARTRKWVHAAAIGVASGLGDIAQQLLTGQVHLERAALAALVMGLFARGLGAALAAIAMPELEPSDGGPGG